MKKRKIGYARISIGTRFGKLVVIELLSDKSNSHSKYKCKCDCEKFCQPRADALLHGYTKSCGCSRVKLAYGELAINYFYSVYQRNASRRNVPFELSRKEFLYLVSQTCHYCGDSPKTYNPFLRNDGKPNRKGLTKETIGRANIKVNGIDRVDSGKGYVKRNCVTACKTCNFAKATMRARNS